jgi:hypothetical protein
MCAAPKDMTALNTRVLQTELMVAALTCGEHEKYNRFVNSYQKVLIDQSGTLRKLFDRTYGSSGTFRLNQFVTRLANDASHNTNYVRDGYCNSAGQLFDEVLSTSPSEFETVTGKPWISQRHGFVPCATKAEGKKQAAAPAKPSATRSN